MNTRALAVKALREIFTRSRKPKEALDDLASGVDRRERAFLMELVYGVLRYRDYLDWMFGGFLKKPSGLSPDTLNNLRIAAYQIKYLRVPEWAAVNEAVEVEKSYGGRVAVVNAVLRNFLRYIDEIAPPPKDDPVRFIAVTTSHPEWMVRRWVRRFGVEEAAKLAEANNEPPPFTIRVEDAARREDALKALAAHGINARPAAYSPAGIILEAAKEFSPRALLETPLPFRYVIQDEASQLISYLLNPLPGERVLDACAAPGGKATHIAQLMKDTGEVIAVEIEERKLGQLAENVARLGLGSIRAVHGDIKNIGLISHIGPIDRILLDAPCSALGVIRRNPDVKYRHAREDLARLRQNQGSMLRAVSGFLKPGGIMVYSVCSTEPEEGEEVIREFLQGSRDFSIIKGDRDFLRPFETGDGFYRTFPQRHNMDGFFAARLKRRD